jgi:hypothetical protein
MTHGRPWHVPVVGWLAVLWTGLSAVDYLLTRFEVGAYLALFSEAQVAYFTGLPLWIDVLWPVAVWLGVAGALSLLGGTRRAAFLLGIAAVAMLLATLGLVFLTDPPMGAVTGPAGIWIMAGSTAVFGLIWLYARQMHAAGHLP